VDGPEGFVEKIADAQMDPLPKPSANLDVTARAAETAQGFDSDNG